MEGDKLKFGTALCAVVWLVGGVLAVTKRDPELREIFIDGFGSLTIVLAIALLVRTILRKRRTAQAKKQD
jgi:hypothetical protein